MVLPFAYHLGMVRGMVLPFRALGVESGAQDDQRGQCSDQDGQKQIIIRSSAIFVFFIFSKGRPTTRKAPVSGNSRFAFSPVF